MHDEIVGHLSHGYRQRVGMAQAVLHDPDLLILDEPTHGLDPAQIVEMRAVIRGLREQHTVLISSHNLPEISQTCDRILVLDAGEIIAAGTEDELSGGLLKARDVEVSVLAKSGAGDVAAVTQLLRGVAGVTEVFNDGASNGALQFRVQASEDRAAEVCRTLVMAGWGVVRLEQSQRKLENVFLELVQGRSCAMRATWIIFRRELGSYLTSAMGYIVAAVTLLLDGLLFYGQALGPAAGARMSTDVLTRFFFTTSGLVAIAAVVLSTRTLAEERQLETLVLLNTSPIRDSQIVAGKFLAALAFLTGITVASVYMPLLILVNGKISFGQVAVGYLGLLMLGSAVLAIGVFASSLTRSQLLAAFLGAAFTGIMFMFWPLSYVIPYPMSVVFAGVAIHGRHFTGFEVGVLQLKDVVYYLAVTYFFLLMSVKAMEAKRWE